MASFPKKPKSSGAKQAANDPMLDAIRASRQEDEPHFGTSPAAVEAANALLVANMRTKLGPAFAAPSGTPRMAAPTIEFAAKPSFMPEVGAEKSAEVVTTESPVVAPVEASAEDIATALPAEPKVIEDAALASFEAAEDSLPAGVSEEVVAGVVSEPAAIETPIISEAANPIVAELSIENKPVDAFDLSGSAQILDPLPPEEELDWRSERISPAALRQSGAGTFDALTTEEDRASRAFPALGEHEFRSEPESPETPQANKDEMFNAWQSPQNPSFRRWWGWVLGALLLVGFGVNFFLLRESSPQKPAAAIAAAPTPKTNPVRPLPVSPAPIVSVETAKPTASLPTAVVAPAPVPPVANAISPVALAPAPRPVLDAQKLLRLLSRP